MSAINNIHVLSRAVILDNDHILLCKTADLPLNFYFLPGGHIEHGESATNAVLRELFEEAGVECRIKKFFECLEYSFEPGVNSMCHNHEYNFVFGVESDELRVHNKLIQLEKHIELAWIPFAEITKIDFRPEPFRELLPQWLKDATKNMLHSVMI